MSLRARVAIAVGVVVFGALAVVAAVVYPVVGVNLRAQSDASLIQVAQQAPGTAGKLKESGRLGQLVWFGDTELQILPDVTSGSDRGSAPGGPKGPISPSIPGNPGSPGTPANGFVAVTAHDAKVASGNAGPYFQDVSYQGVEYRVYTSQFPGNLGALLRVARPEADATAPQETLGWLLLILVPSGAIVAAVLARLAAGRVLRPVARLTEAVERIRDTGDLSAPIGTPGVGTPGKDEISRLGQAFGAMTAALDDSVTAQRRLVADASHELRTPLTSLTTNLELLKEQPDDRSAPSLVSAALAETGQLRDLVSDLVELARDGESPLHMEDVRLDLVAARVAARVVSRAGKRVADEAVDPGPRFDLNLQPTLVRGDPDALERAIGNLVDNALKWSPPHGCVRVSAAHGTVEVSDEGPGIAAEDLPYIFDRFYRSAAARALPGSGLGLAIVRRIASLHDGTVEAIPLGKGVKFRLILPEALGQSLVILVVRREKLLRDGQHRHIARLQPFRRAGRAERVDLHVLRQRGLRPSDLPLANEPLLDVEHERELPAFSQKIMQIAECYE